MRLTFPNMYSPGHKQSRGDAQDGVESRNGIGEDESSDPEESAAAEPHTPSHDCVVGQFSLGLDDRVHDEVVHELNGSVCPNTRPEPSIVGIRMPYATFEATPGAEPSAGETTY